MGCSFQHIPRLFRDLHIMCLLVDFLLLGGYFTFHMYGFDTKVQRIPRVTQKNWVQDGLPCNFPIYNTKFSMHFFLILLHLLLYSNCLISMWSLSLIFNILLLFLWLFLFSYCPSLLYQPHDLILVLLTKVYVKRTREKAKHLFLLAFVLVQKTAVIHLVQKVWSVPVVPRQEHLKGSEEKITWINLWEL